jgi:hypothetical protein
MAAPRDEDGNTIDRNSQTTRAPKVVLVVGAALLAVAAIIFSAAGPDRSRTTQYKDTIPSSVNPRDGAREKTVPEVDVPTAPPSR